MNAILTFDFGILDWLQLHCRSEVLDFILSRLTHLGDAGIFWILLTVIFLIIPKTRRTGLTMTLALVCDVLLCNILIKPLVARIRPYDLNTAVTLLIKAPTDYSFPSGHTAASFATTMALFLRKDKLWIPALVLSIVIAFSRLYLYVHYPTDVFAGLLIGILSGWLGYMLANLCFAHKERCPR